MFTGIVEELGEVASLEWGPDGARLTVRGPLVVADAVPGASIAVNGVCLTVVEHDARVFTADVMAVTLGATSLGDLVPGAPVNLERAVPAGGRLGGHVVQGHVDGTGTVVERVPGQAWELVRIAVPRPLARYVVIKGSLAVDGVSLTVADLADAPDGSCTVTVSLIPETLARTTLGRRRPGERVNLEVDVLAKYAERLPADDAGAAHPGFGAADSGFGTADSGFGTADSGCDPIRLDGVRDALAALAEGRPVLVVDAADRENEGDVIMAAQHATEQWIGWTVRHTSGVLCAPMPDAHADRLGLPPMVARNEDPRRTAYTVSVDARRGVGTGISAADRASTLRTLADPASQLGDLVRPGHVFPLRARPGGVLERAGHTEAAVDLCRLAGLEPVGVIAEVVRDSGELMRLPELRELADRHRLPLVSIADLAAHRLAVGDAPPPARPTAALPRVERVAESTLPTTHGRFRAVAYRDLLTGAEHLAVRSVLIPAEGSSAAEGSSPTRSPSPTRSSSPAQSSSPTRSPSPAQSSSPAQGAAAGPLVRVHSECLTGDALGSVRCDCGPQLEAALATIAQHGGVLVYLRGHEGRGIGLAAKLAAYHLQDGGLDTVAANTAQGLPADAREYGAAAAILRDLGLERVRLLTNNPAKVAGLTAHGVDVSERVPLLAGLGPDNVRYLVAKRDLLGHLIEVPADGHRPPVTDITMVEVAH